MLDSYDPQTQQFTHHCHNPKCKYHNCKNWEPFRECEHHDGIQHMVILADVMRQMLEKSGSRIIDPDQITDTIVTQVTRDRRVEGETKTHHVSHPDIQWVDHDLVALPTCECGSQMFLKVNFTEEELSMPNIKVEHRDPKNHAIITHFTQHPAVERHQQLAKALTAMGTTFTPEEIETHAA